MNRFGRQGGISGPHPEAAARAAGSLPSDEDAKR